MIVKVTISVVVDGNRIRLEKRKKGIAFVDGWGEIYMSKDELSAWSPELGPGSITLPLASCEIETENE